VKAVGIIGMGDPDVVQVIDAADPSCGPSEVMIRPEATSYNHLDALLRQEILA
jgi:NADPH:quinone reductase-like Zn-dependent oxidoreductase